MILYMSKACCTTSNTSIEPLGGTTIWRMQYLLSIITSEDAQLNL